MKQKQFYTYIPWALVILSLTLKLVHITTYPIQLDEPFSIFTSNLAWSEFWHVFLTENNPPLHPILLKFIIGIFGLNDFWMRFLSVALSSFAVYFIYKTAYLIEGIKSALIASLLFCFSSLQVSYSHQIRAYALVVFLSAASVYLLIKVIKEDHNKAFISLGLINALLLYTHFMGLVFVALSGISLFIFFNEKRTFKKLLYSFGITILLFSPYLPIFLDRLLWVNGDSWVEPPSSPMSIYFVFWKFCNAPLTTVLAIITLVSGIVFIKQFENIKKVYSLLLALTFLSFIGLYFTSLKFPIYVDRYLIFIAPTLYTLLALIITKLIRTKNEKLNLGLIFVLPILFAVTFKIDSDINQSKTNDWKIINDVTEPKIVVLSPAWNDVNYCYHTNKQLYFTKTKLAFDEIRKQNGVFKDYELVDTWKENATDKRVFVSIDDNRKHDDFQNMLQKHFIQIQELGNGLYEYRVK